jgi:glucuronoarabinoxylan endo-1,4-beta-xylanase
MNTRFRHLPLLLLCLFPLVSCVARDDERVVVATVDFERPAQRIEGFGASIVGWHEDMVGLYRDPAYLDFVVGELGLSIFRMQVWGPVGVVPKEDWTQITYKDFDWSAYDNRAQVNNDFARALKARDPSIKIIGSIWSPPPWMKENGSLTGTGPGFLLAGDDPDNRLRDDRYKHYAKFLVEYQKYLIENGIGLYAFGPQNEPMFTQSFESCLFSGEEYARLVRTLGEMYAHEKVEKPLFYGPEDMTLASYNPDGTTVDQTRHNAYVENLMRDDVAPYFDIWATHGYSDGVNPDQPHNTTDYWKSIKKFGLPYWLTEGGTGGHEWPTPITNGVATRIHATLVGGHAEAFVCWQISEAKPSSHAIMLMDQPTPKTYAAMHYWRFIRPDSVRLEVEGGDDSVLLSAYQRPDGALVIVAINPKDAPCDLALGLRGTPATAFEDFQVFRTSADENLRELEPLVPVEGSLDWRMPAYSIVTLVGSPLSEEPGSAE